MTQTVQSRSCGYLNETEKSINKPETEDNTTLLLSLFDSLNNLCEKLTRLDYVIKRKKLELSLYRKCEEEPK
ncbi:MAG: hypothetical protein LBC76_04730 [Treponema sp.]|jgi:hypothetical protein|nr:hypothetical protein [Treponema sp.]